MRELCSNLSNTVPIRPRVAFVLAIAERVIAALAENVVAFNTVQKALADGWRWEQAEDVRAAQLYEDHVEALALQDSLISDDKASAAICAATSAFYYLMWHAFLQDLNRGMVSVGMIPNDIADVSENTMNYVCEFAAQTSMCDRSWITALADRLSADYRTPSPEELGPVVPREYFK